ncbi:Cyclin domain protein [Aphelenchoides besseyi]|nr:Cyclin domain protein [Aphelenchoides besseyi]
MANASKNTRSMEKSSRKRPIRQQYEEEEDVLENDENLCLGYKTPQSKKARYSKGTLERTMPDILNSSQEFGSPHKFWSSLCERDESYVRDAEYIKKLKLLRSDMRVKLIYWIMTVCEDLKLHRETFHLALDFIDRFLTKQAANTGTSSSFKPDGLQLLAISSLMLATKIEEIYPPKLAHLIDLTDGAVLADQARRMEEVIITTLEWHCSPVTSIQWLAFYLQLISQREIVHTPLDCSFSMLDAQPRTRGQIVLPTSSPLTAISVSDSLPSIRSVEEDSSRMIDPNSSFDTSFAALDHAHMRHLQSFSVPKIIRDDFMILTKVLDLCVFDMQFLQFTYSEVAAAVVMCFYEPKDLVEKVTAFRYEDVRKALAFVAPVVKMVRSETQPGVELPLDSRDQHNIQPIVYDKEDTTIMKYVAAYLLANLGGKANPSVGDLESILGSVGAEFEKENAETVVKLLNGKEMDEVISSGLTKLATVPSGGGSAAPAASSAAPAQDKPAEKPAEKKASDCSINFPAIVEDTSRIVERLFLFILLPFYYHDKTNCLIVFCVLLKRKLRRTN